MTGLELRPPDQSGGSPAEQLRALQSYLCSLTAQLQYAFDTLEGRAGTEKIVYAATAAPTTPTAAERQQELSRLKSLILKSAQVTAVLEQRVEQRLEGKYVAESQFGAFCQETSQAIAANSRAIEQQFTNVQQLDSAVEQLRSSVREVSATIRSGELADGVYGVEIGQQEGEDGVIRFRRYARLTAQKLSFYDSNDVEVAYVSDRRLHITAADAAQITTQSLTAAQLQMGDYTWQISTDGHLSVR